MNQTNLQTITQEIIAAQPRDAVGMAKIMRYAASKLGQSAPKKTEILATYRQMVATQTIPADPGLEKLLTTRAVRTLSGVSIITVLTKPYRCPGKCVYCPTERGMPKSYLSNEPAAQRAVRNQFDPQLMVSNRIKALETNGHIVDKIELIVLGGTWSAYPRDYQTDFITQCIYAANTYGETEPRAILSLIEEQQLNESARYRIIGITLETRPDHITAKEVCRLRQLGCTRVQLGVQHTDDAILNLIQRGDTLANAIKATRLLKEAGFKVDHHYMPDLPGSTPEKDLAMFEYIFTKPDLQPDQIKIYPCVVNEFALLNTWHREGRYTPYAPEILFKLLLDIEKVIPPYVRVNRLIRDIPGESIIAGNNVTNLRQYLDATATEEGWRCQCIHCREVRDQEYDASQAELVTRTYEASHGTEHFISWESPDRQILYAFLRLRFNHQPNLELFPELQDAALVRELHVYGQMTQVGSDSNQSQHRGFGRQLMEHAEQLARQQGYKKIAVISGIGVREYYRKLGYELIGTYMIKTLATSATVEAIQS